jgi:hypothetical protein
VHGGGGGGGGGGGAADCDTVNVFPPALIVPVRAAPVFVETVNATVPLPVPDTPLEIEIHPAFDAAVHEQVAADALIANDPDPPDSDRLTSVGEIENVHGGGAAACETVNVLPAAVMVPVRAPSGFAVTLKETVPFPAPDPPPVIVIHDAFDAAVQAHVAADAVTAIDPDPPTSDTDWSDGAIVKVHAGGGGGGVGAAACDTVNVRPAAVIDPVRAPPEFAATVKDTVPLPVPDPPLVIVIQDALDVAVQAHVVPDAVTAIDPDPPPSDTA